MPYMHETAINYDLNNNVTIDLMSSNRLKAKGIDASATYPYINWITNSYRQN